MKSQHRNLPRLLLLLPLVGLALGLSTGVVQAIARTYKTADQSLQIGMVVRLAASDPDNGTVERAEQEDSTKVAGVVTTFENPTIVLVQAGAKVVVENEGYVEAYVSNINGSIGVGDPLSLSPFKGILMRADNGGATNIGVAAYNTDSSQQNYSYQENGQTKSTVIQKIGIHLGAQPQATDTVADSSLTRIGRRLAGKDVSETRVLIAAAIFIIVLIAEGGIIYGGVSSFMISLGRNPLARRLIRKELLKVVALAMLLLITGLGLSYGALII